MLTKKRLPQIDALERNLGQACNSAFLILRGDKLVLNREGSRGT